MCFGLNNAYMKTYNIAYIDVVVDNITKCLKIDFGKEDIRVI